MVFHYFLVLYREGGDGDGEGDGQGLFKSVVSIGKSNGAIGKSSKGNVGKGLEKLGQQEVEQAEGAEGQEKTSIPSQIIIKGTAGINKDLEQVEKEIGHQIVLGKVVNIINGLTSKLDSSLLSKKRKLMGLGGLGYSTSSVYGMGGGTGGSGSDDSDGGSDSGSTSDESGEGTSVGAGRGSGGSGGYRSRGGSYGSVYKPVYVYRPRPKTYVPPYSPPAFSSYYSR
jgi:hypothetical protein